MPMFSSSRYNLTCSHFSFLATIGLLLVISYTNAKDLPFKKFKVLRIIPRCEKDLEVLRGLQHSNMEELDFWREPLKVNRTVDVMVPPELQEKIFHILNGMKIDVKVAISDVQALVDEEERAIDPNQFDYNQYNTYETIQKSIITMNKPSQIASALSLGKSYEGRDIGYLKLLEGGTEAKRLLKKFDFYIIPVLNVDGYVYTWSKRRNRFWRKTRKPNPGSICVGTDPNRNFVTGWSGEGSSNNPCSPNFHGSSPFSEPEIQAVRDLVDRLGGYEGVALYLDYHSYGQQMVSSYGFTDTKPANYDLMYAGAEPACNALKAVNGTEYKYGTVTDVIYPVSGISIDYMYAGQGVHFTYTFEGRDTGEYGFLLPQEYIRPSGEENWAAFSTLCNFVYDHDSKI